MHEFFGLTTVKGFQNQEYTFLHFVEDALRIIKQQHEYKCYYVLMILEFNRRSYKEMYLKIFTLYFDHSKTSNY